MGNVENVSDCGAGNNATYPSPITKPEGIKAGKERPELIKELEKLRQWNRLAQQKSMSGRKKKLNKIAKDSALYTPIQQEGYRRRLSNSPTERHENLKLERSGFGEFPSVPSFAP